MSPVEGNHAVGKAELLEDPFGVGRHLFEVGVGAFRTHDANHFDLVDWC